MSYFNILCPSPICDVQEAYICQDLKDQIPLSVKRRAEGESDYVPEHYTGLQLKDQGEEHDKRHFPLSSGKS